MKPAPKLDGDPAQAPELRQRDRLLKVVELAAWLNKSPRAAYRLVTAGHFRCCKIGGSLRIFESSVSAYLERQIDLYELENGLPNYDKR